MATRKQQANKMSQARAKETKNKIENITKGMFAFEYKTKKGTWNISKIAKDTNTSRTTVYKYIEK